MFLVTNLAQMLKVFAIMLGCFKIIFRKQRNIQLPAML